MISPVPSTVSRRGFMAAVGTLGTTASLTACGTSGSDPNHTLYTWISNAGDREQWQAFVTGAKKDDPGFTLTLEGPSFSDYWTKVKTRMSSRNVPALLTTQAARTQELRALLAPLDELADAAGVDLSQYNEAMMSGMTVDGTVRAIPYDAEPLVVYYNRALFEAAGIDEPGRTFTTDEFLDDAKKLTTDDQYGVALTNSLVALGMAIGVANGAEPVKDLELRLTDPALVQGIQFCFDLVTEHAVAKAPPALDSDAAAQQALINGQAGMMADGPWMYQTFADALGDDLGVAIIPSDHGDPVGMLQGSGFGIASVTEDMSGAFDTLSAITAPDVLGYVAATRGTFPSVVSQEDVWKKDKPEATAIAAISMVRNGKPLITTPTWNEVSTQFEQYATNGFRGTRTAAQILDEVTKAVGS